MSKQLKTALYGLAIGDARGVPFGCKSRGSFHTEECMMLYFGKVLPF